METNFRIVSDGNTAQKNLEPMVHESGSPENINATTKHELELRETAVEVYLSTKINILEVRLAEFENLQLHEIQNEVYRKKR